MHGKLFLNAKCPSVHVRRRLNGRCNEIEWVDCHVEVWSVRSLYLWNCILWILNLAYIYIYIWPFVGCSVETKRVCYKIYATIKILDNIDYIMFPLKNLSSILLVLQWYITWLILILYVIHVVVGMNIDIVISESSPEKFFFSI